MAKTLVVALHGFLGHPRDWLQVSSKLTQFDFIAPNLLATGELGPEYDFTTWAKNFNQWVKEHSDPNQEKILLAYSMGARLGLYALEDESSLWKSAVLISVHPGLSYQSERDLRLKNDHTWAQKFLEMPWQPLMKEWQNQGALKDSQEPKREENTYQRKFLAMALTQWSQGKQKDFQDFLSKTDRNIFLLTGDKDTKFTDLSKSLTLLNKKVRHQVALNSGHRVLWDHPLCVVDLIQKS